eukprot:CAMPEP_0194307134 /NCGR_PEP_ID=MMETSP0171-20130528/3994_1 /TAXON_ID=218684 /ORGANISM="Corethron pennatum, Strain L29A3" /LENGTH=820 /DNA_ID=CAMNT_0039059029 /DNA_START=105 /DNA_END=2567 /DNA_ORIENTATION=+
MRAHLSVAYRVASSILFFLFYRAGAVPKTCHPHAENIVRATGRHLPAKFSSGPAAPEISPADAARRHQDVIAVEAQVERHGRHLRRLERKARRRLQAENGTAPALSASVSDDGDDTTDDVGTPFSFFVAHNSTMTCTEDAHAFPFMEKIKGVNLGSWMVLEPWITPGLFYQFIGGHEKNTAQDMWTFCEVLGPEEGNRQLRNHWATWVTEEIIRSLSEDMGINSVRLPVGDWMYVPYGPYQGCTDGALEFVDRLLEWCEKYSISVLLDVHAQKGSQNGFDNSGQAMEVRWTSKINAYPAGLVTFEHWNQRTASWLGKFSRELFAVPEVDHGNIAHSLKVIEEIVRLYRYSSVIYGVEPVNEPWEWSPMEVLKSFYWEGYLIVKRDAPKWKFVMHDSFRFDVNIWKGFMDGCPERVLDTHIYQAWLSPASRISFYNNACSWKEPINEMEKAFGPVFVGEWSLATDNCAMWLNGFNDNLSGFPMLPCKYMPCRASYIKGNVNGTQPGVPLSKNQPLPGPYGTGVSGPSWGMCPTGRDWLKEHSANVQNGTDWILAPPAAPNGRDASNEVMTNLARKKINTFFGIGHGFYFWNFRTELEEPHWDYMEAVRRGWIPAGTFNTPKVTTACRREDEGSFTCQLNRYAETETIKGAVSYCLSVEKEDQEWLGNVSDSTLRKKAPDIINMFWKKHRLNGATCDFGGIAYLVEDKEISDDEFDDSYETEYENRERNPAFYLFYSFMPFLLGLIIATLGFILFMKTNKRFNVKVRSMSIFKKARNHSVFTGRNSLLGASYMPKLIEDPDAEEDAREEERLLLLKVVFPEN